jgi:hypothetical protein
MAEYDTFPTYSSPPAATNTNAGWLGGISGLMQFMGSMWQGKAAAAEAKRQKESSDFSAWQAEEQAGLAIASAQRKAFEEQRLGRLASSKILSIAAASGGGASDPTIVHLIAAQTAISGYRANVAVFEGDSKARQLMMEAGAQRIAGAQATEIGAERKAGYELAGEGALAKGAMSLYAKYGFDGFSRGDNALISDYRSSNPGVNPRFR